MTSVLHVLPRDDGRFRHVATLTRALAREGVRGAVLVGGEAPEEPAGVPVHTYPWPAPLADASAEHEALGWAACLRALTARAPDHDIVHVHGLTALPSLARIARTLVGTPFVTSGTEVGLARATAADYGDALIAPYPRMRGRLADLVPQTPVLLVPHPLDAEELTEEPWLGNEIRYVGPVGRPQCPPALATALARVLEKPVQSPPDDLADVLADTGLLVVADGTEPAAFRLVLTAAARGVPLVVLNGADDEDLMTVLGPDHPGLVPKGASAETVADAALDLLGSPARQAVLDTVRKGVRDQFSTAGVASRHRDVYRAVAEGRPLPEWRGGHQRIPMALPDITSAEVRAAARSLVSGRLSQGPEVELFEAEFAQWHGGHEAVAVNSAASALFAALVCAGIRGEVLVPSFTWATTANVVVAAGATPVFVDIDDDTLGIGPEAVAAALGPRTEAVICVHYAGHPCRVAELAELCGQHGLLLVEDAAEATGARQNDRLVGTFGVGCYSFYGTKNMTTGEGGMVLADDPALAARIRTLRRHGMRAVPGSPYPWRKEAVTAGFNFRMPEPLAAVGRRQLHRLSGMNARRHELAERLDGALAAFEGAVRPHTELPGFLHAYHMYVARVRDRAVRDHVVMAMRARGVDASVHFDPPVHEQEFYRGHHRLVPDPLRVTGEVADTVLTLPLYTTMSDRSVDRVAESLARALDTAEAGGAP
ncbi:aminotransferase class I/II-fold pyridoxal phosphate-dependent enzyme [Streptomyces sp. NPDC046939]|uniref:aminotransferase class I/II-fold pyridoxal phosphate-dependent enzyme n=1 Tax=Streptomyces sp. NPDC046939 TaxID=3155376 RepID=UPI0033FD3F08